MARCLCGKTDLIGVEFVSLNGVTPPGGAVALCPNCALDEALWPKLQPKEMTERCVICGRKAHMTMHDFKFNDERTKITYPVCHDHFRAIAKLALTPAEFRHLLKFVGEISFNIHDDFYDPDSGKAVQPKGERKRFAELYDLHEGLLDEYVSACVKSCLAGEKDERKLRDERHEAKLRLNRAFNDVLTELQEQTKVMKEIRSKLE